MTERVQGLDAVIRSLQRVARALPEEVQERAALAGGQVIADEAKRRVPVRTGNLRDSITVGLTAPTMTAVTLREGGVSVSVGPKSGGKPNGFYGHFVEFGTINMPAQPFMRPAFDATRDEAIKAMSVELWAPVEKAARG